MTLLSEILGRQMRLIAAETTDVLHEPNLPVPAQDGVVLLADRWVASAGAQQPQPTVLVRSPYGRRSLVGLLFGRLLAERGLQVLIQSVRGTFGSGGHFSPFEERADGLDTLRWIRQQPWHRDRIGMIGPSYLGLVQWALAAGAGDDLAALAIQVSASQFYEQSWTGGGISLENTISWMTFLAFQEGRLAAVAVNRAMRRLPAAMRELPLGELDVAATGAQVGWFREAFANPGRSDAYWERRDYSAGVADVTASVQFVGGWYDILLPWMLDDFTALQAADRRPQLTIGPWAHTSPGLAARGHRDGIAWLRGHLLGDDRLLRAAPVRILVTGEREGGGWRELETWPPPGMGERRLSLRGGGGLTMDGPADHDLAEDRTAAPTTTYTYDPSDPTPARGGPVLLSRHPVLDNRELEARADVVTFTTEPLPASVEAIGEVSAELWVASDAVSFDVFARVCDVDADGASWNVCDGLARVTRQPPDGGAGDGDDGDDDGRVPAPAQVAVTLWPMGHRFAAGHRIRLQVSSGAHPRYARNPGTGENPATATELRPAAIVIHHDAEHPSVLSLPSASAGAAGDALATTAATA